MNWLLVIVLVILLFQAVKGWRKGFLGLLISIAALIIFIAVIVFTIPVIEGFLEEHAGFAASSGIEINAAALIEILPFLLAAVFAFLVVRLLKRITRGVNRIPLIGAVNRMFGLCLGIFKGLCIVWILFLILSVIAISTPGQLALLYIDNSAFLSLLYENNLISDLIFTR